MLLHYITWNVDPVIFHVGNFAVRWYSLLFALAFLFGYFIFIRIFKKEGISLVLLDKLLLYVFLGTLLGARIGHCLFYEPQYYLQHPLEIILPIRLTDMGVRFIGYQGLASHGGAIGILIALYFYARSVKKPMVWILDRIVIPVALAGFFIRMGNLMNSEIYGLETQLPWGFIFVKQNEAVPKHPTQIYEALAYLVIFIVLISLYFRKNGKIYAGFLTGLFFIAVFAARFMIEFVKEIQVPFEKQLALNMGQLLSIPFIVAGIIFLLWAYRKRKII